MAGVGHYHIGMSTPTVQVVTLPEIDGEWQRILPACWTNNPFVTPWWQGTWIQHFGDDKSVQIIWVRDGPVTLGVAPLIIKDGIIKFLGGPDLSDYSDFLVPYGCEQRFYPILWHYFQSLKWDRMEYQSIPEGSPTLGALARLARSDGFSVRVGWEGATPVRRLPLTWDDYVRGLAKKNRHELRRKIRKLNESGEVKQYDCTPQTLEADMDDFFRLMRASAPEKDQFMTPVREHFFRDIARVLSVRGELKLSMLEFEGKRVASCINIDYAGSYFLYNSGYDPELSKLSVGLVNKASSIREAINAGRGAFNFLRGSERYKYDLGAEDRSVYELIIAR